jgi:hypothetical protein
VLWSLTRLGEPPSQFRVSPGVPRVLWGTGKLGRAAVRPQGPGPATGGEGYDGGRGPGAQRGRAAAAMRAAAAAAVLAAI